MKRVLILLTISFFTASPIAFSQISPNGLVQFSGVVVTGDSLKPVPFAGIVIRNSFRGTVSDYYGFFSFVAQMGDTIDFSAVGYKKSSYIIPDTLKTDRYSLIKIMSVDTITLPEAVIYPWPTKEQFRQAFLNLRVPDDDLDRARRNMALQEMRDMMVTLPLDGSGNYKALMLEQQNRTSGTGQYPTYSLLNPLAWAKFIEAWQRGDFRSKNNK